MALLFVAAGIAVLVAGGELMLRGAVRLATLWRLSPAVIGLTVVAAGTSIPELAVSGVAAAQGSADIAMANVVGSNIFNMAFILGLCAMIRPFAIAGNTLRLEYPVLLLMTLFGLVIAQDLLISRLDALLCIAFYIGFTAYVVQLVRGQASAVELEHLDAGTLELLALDAPPTLLRSLGLVAGGVALLALGAQLTVHGASDLARLWGWSERLIGLTIVSIGTGLPEVVASLVSSLRGRSDMAVGNIIGSNLFNILMVVGITAGIAPLPVSAALFNSDMLWMLGITLLLLPLMWTGWRVNRVEGGLLLAVYGVYLG
ncbi:MAG: calcium/sodium antiporter, partial [Paraperlucidibaca sp.]